MNYTINCQISDDEIINFIQNEIKNGNDKCVVIEKILSIGVAVWERVQSSRDVEFVKNELKGMTDQFEHLINKLEKDIEEKIKSKMDNYFNPDIDGSYMKKTVDFLRDRLSNFNEQIKPLLSNVKSESKLLIENAGKISSEKTSFILDEIKAAKDNFNPELETSYLGKLKKSIEEVEKNIHEQLNDRIEGTFAKKLKEDTIKLFGADSPILISIDEILKRHTDSFNNELIKLREVISKKEGEKDMLSKASAKGAVFEHEIESKLNSIAKITEDSVEYIGETPEEGTQKKKGDFKYTFKEGIEILIEVEDKENLTRSYITNYLNEAMQLRGTKFSIFVSKNESQLPNFINAFGFYENNKIITSSDYLEFALRWARLYLTKIEGSIIEGVNKSAILDKSKRIIEKINEFSKIKSKLTNIENTITTNVTSIKSILDEIKNEINDLINEIDAELEK
ncbi:MAG: hypothetical protein GXO79_10430 [Chlorobi bacterium]|nr:hypothetical protein [Chlorobiota bacterium]